MGSRFLKDAAGFLLACLIGGALVAYHHRAHFDPHIVWDGFTLPGFDAHVYVAMAEEPRVFTVGPWGYRILLPAVLGTLLPSRLIVPGFEWAARLSLVLASGLLFAYLRVLGGTFRAALLAVIAMMLTPSVGVVFVNPFLVEPFALMLFLLALIAIEANGSAWALSLSFILLSLCKEIWLLLLPLVFLKEVGAGIPEAARRTLRLAAPALWINLLIRWLWTPQAGAAPADSDYLGALASIVSHIGVFAPQFLLGGLGVAAVLALHREEARDYLARHALTLLPLLALPLFAAAYTGEGAATSFFADDVQRLLIYVIPLAAGLAIHLDPAHGSPAGPRPRPWLDRAARVVVIALLIAPLALDRYSRADLRTSRDGPYVLGFTRETLRTARKLDRGETVILDPAERKFAWGVTPPNELQKLRFFLRNGFGPLAHYGIHDIKMREASATLVIPILEPRRLAIKATMDARESTWVTFLAGGAKVGEALVGPQAVTVTLDVAATKLFRGDNPIEMRCEKAATGLPRILRLELSQSATRP
ncbi:MAG: hypothetical protein K1Y01_10525 [Vicinamibacteria bacterium]|nr:hypothetical protein [Vicinamibacteria bacterium]